MSIKRVASGAVLGAAALLTGVASVKPVMALVMDRLAVHDGPWRILLYTGLAEAGLYERAAIAVAGLYALSKEETVYYTAFTDNQGRPLDGRCDYWLSGRPLPARWWSLTMYGADNYLVANSAGIYSRHVGNLDVAPDGSYVVPVSAQARPGNWLPAPAQGRFSITARLYNPEPSVLAAPAAVALPAIERGTCR